MELDKITPARWVDQALEQSLTKKNQVYKNMAFEPKGNG
jgi:hypothetical protein